MLLRHVNWSLLEPEQNTEMSRSLSQLASPAALAGLLAALVFSGPVRAANLPDKVDFNYHIKPLLSDRCYACHGPDEKARKARLRLDQKEGAFKALEDGQFVIKPGDLAKSEVFRRITTADPDDLMPPPKSNLSLSRDEVELIRRWIEQGAQWDKHWSFVPVKKVELPKFKNTAWLKNDLDAFVLARLEQEGLKPTAEASKERLIRRVTFDLTGLPPTLAEIDDFLADTSPRAHEHVVDRLLASPTYGERMAVDWLDVARYADTYGYQADRFNHLWPWRDWVISAFNRNLPFDDFIIWQIAGDLLPNATREQKTATAFNRNHRQTNEGGSVDEEFRVEYNADRVHTTAGAFMGLTIECARCHDHKYDPISQKDYYRLFAFFNSTDESGLYSHFTDAIPSPALVLYKDDAQEQKHKELKAAIRAKEKEVRNFTGGGGLVAHYTFDDLKVTNSVSTNFTAKVSESPKLVTGKSGNAFQFNGENSVAIEKVANFKRSDPFSFSLWLKIPEELEEIVVMHHQQAGSDAGYHGYQLILERGHASLGLIHFWPGNAIKVRTREKLRTNEWVQVGITYDGSSRASGVKLYVDGKAAEVEVVRDHLYKDFANNQPLILAARFRGRGFKDGLIDDLRVYNRCLTAAEMADGQLRNEQIVASDELQKLRKEENEFINSIPEIMIMGDLPKARPTFLLKRGAYDAHGDVVEPGTPESILPLDPKLPKNRLGLAKWLTAPKNPLTSRVIVNRYWQMFFGRGIVASSEDFGSQGQLPSHPELLDWLAQRFMDSGWNLKALHKLIVMSATYRQASEATPELLARDPDNKLLARGTKQRLTAEMLRDQALAAAGLLVGKVGGPSVKPYQPEGLWEEKSAAWKYEPDKGEGLYRRSMYTYWKRTSPHPAMTTFDAAERNSCVVRRQTTSTPLQALVLLNDPQFVEAAQKIAERASKEAGTNPDDRIRYTFRLLTGRAPTDKQMRVLERLYEEQCSTNERSAGTALASAILNFDDSIMKR
jgi:hypothetical protein